MSLSLVAQNYFAGNKRENSVILAHANALAGENFCAALAHENSAGGCLTSRSDLDAEILRIGITAIFCRTG